MTPEEVRRRLQVYRAKKARAHQRAAKRGQRIVARHARLNRPKMPGRRTL